MHYWPDPTWGATMVLMIFCLTQYYINSNSVSLYVEETCNHRLPKIGSTCPDDLCLHSWLVLADIKLMTLWGPWYAYECEMLFGCLPLYSLNYSHLHSVGTDQIPACLAEYWLLPTYDTLRMLPYGYGYLNLYKWNISFSVSWWGVYIC